jgi:hypothetical protein
MHRPHNTFTAGRHLAHTQADQTTITGRIGRLIAEPTGTSLYIHTRQKHPASPALNTSPAAPQHHHTALSPDISHMTTLRGTSETMNLTFPQG